MISSLAAALVAVATGVWPLQPDPEVAAPFDPPAESWSAGHRGVDLMGHPGQPVHAALAGTVSFAGRIAGRGVVVVDHGSTRTTYEPVEATVATDDVVVAGQVLGQLEWFGSHCLPRACLHWGLIEGADSYRDPLSLIGCAPSPVRLLPLDAPAPSGDGCTAWPEPAGHALLRTLVSTQLRLADALDGRPGAAAPP